MAHFVRPLALAEALDPDRYQVYFYAPARFSRYLQNKAFVVGELASMPGEQFLTNIGKGAPLFPTNVLRGYVKQELALIESTRPELVIAICAFTARQRCFRCFVCDYYQRLLESLCQAPAMPSLPITRVILPRLRRPSG
jgi:UDP:flavonoid glycosyltransferase YjiC (YdhE family)